MKTTSSKKPGAKHVGSAASDKGAGYEDQETFARGPASPTPEYDTRKAKSARGHDDQGGSRQSESRDYERVQAKPGGAGAGARKPSDEGTHSDQRHAHERYGEQTAGQRQDSKARERQQNLGGQDSRDQSTGDRFSLLGRAGGTAGDAREQAIEPQQTGSAGAGDSAAAGRSGDTLSEQGRREEERRSARGDAGYDTNWTREDKGGQPGPAAAGSDKDKKRSSGR